MSVGMEMRLYHLRNENQSVPRPHPKHQDHINEIHFFHVVGETGFDLGFWLLLMVYGYHGDGAL